MKILCATDFSRRSDVAIERAAALAREARAGIVLLNVVDDDEPQPMVDQRFEQARNALVARVARLVQTAAVHVTPEVRVGTPFRTIIEAARDAKADMIVMGAPRRRLLQDVIVGTTTERVLRTGGHPVLVVNVPDAAPYTSVLAALDASDASARALRVAKSLGLLDAAQVSVVHAFEPIYKGMMSWAGVTENAIASYSEGWATQAGEELQRFLASQGFPDAGRRLVLEEGPPLPSIRKVVERTRPQLLVIGTRGLSGIRKLLLGSVAERVLTEIDCDILAVPPLVERRE
jgi:nucleotide-binding universal stress UspA family protein